MEINHKFINFILIILITYILIKNISNEKKLKSIEKFVNVQDVDIDAIRNLSEIAKELQKGGLTVAGDLTVTGKIKTKNIDVGENLQIEGGTKFTKNDIDNTIKGVTTFSNNLKINGTTNANSIEASNVTVNNNVIVNNNVTVANKIQSKHLDITNGSTDEEAWTKFNNGGKNYMSGHNWIEAKGHLTVTVNEQRPRLNNFMQYKGFKPGYIGFGRISNSKTQKDVTNVIAHSLHRTGGAYYFHAQDHVNKINYMELVDSDKNPKVRDVVGIATPNQATSPGGIYRSHTNPISDNKYIQDNVFYYKK